MGVDLHYVDRRETDCIKWDGLQDTFGHDDLLAMWVADMDFKAPQPVIAALGHYVTQGVFGYGKMPDGYLDAVTDWEARRHDYAVPCSAVRFTPGVVAGFNWFLQLMSQPGDAVIVLTPVYYPFLNAVRQNERRLITSELKNDHGVYTIDFADFERKIEENHVQVFILCSPHNPVGRVWTRGELETLLNICRRHGVRVISDEIHQDLVYGENRHIPTATVGDYDDMLVTLIAPSKTFNLAGLQHSIALIPDETLRRAFDDFTLRLRVQNGNAMGYIACEAAYREGEEWLAAVKETVYGNYLFLRDTLLAKLPKLVISPLEGTYLMWIDFSAYLKPEEIEDFFTARCSLAFDFGKWFEGAGACHVRVNLATRRENVALAAQRILENLQ